MADFTFDGVPSVLNKYLNPNIWLSDGKPEIYGSTVRKNGEIEMPEPGGQYYFSAAVQNNGPTTQPVTVHFFLCDSSTTPLLTSTRWTNPPQPPPPPPGFSVPSATDNVVIAGGKGLCVLDPHHDRKIPSESRLCLVCVIDDGSDEFLYPITRTPKPVNVSVEGNPSTNPKYYLIAQHNVDIATQARSGSGINGFGYLSLYGLRDRTPSSLILRTPGRDEIQAIRELLSSSVRMNEIRDVTTEIRAGFFESEPGRENPVEEDELHELPVRMPIEGLEPNCERRVYWGIKLPNSDGESEDVPAAFILLEQVTEEGKVLGGILIVAASRELPLPDPKGYAGGCRGDTE